MPSDNVQCAKENKSENRVVKSNNPNTRLSCPFGHDESSLPYLWICCETRPSSAAVRAKKRAKKENQMIWRVVRKRNLGEVGGPAGVAAVRQYEPVSVDWDIGGLTFGSATRSHCDEVCISDG